MNKKIFYFIGESINEIDEAPHFYPSIDKSEALKNLAVINNEGGTVKLFLVEITEVPTDAIS